MSTTLVNEVWYGSKRPSLLLRSLESVYGWGSALHRKRAARNIAADLVDRPIIVVGNITAGGTGKSPLVMRLCELLGQAGLKPAVISRGYGRSSREPVSVNADTPAEQAGDEAAMMARRTGVPVFVDSQRENAARRAFEHGADVVISDDGLQRLSLPRRMEICVIDGTRGLGNGRLLPAGPLREPASRVDSVDTIVWNGNGTRPHDRPATAIAMQLEPIGWVRLGDQKPLKLEAAALQFGRQCVHLVAGIGHPQRFFDTVARLGIKADQEHGFDDHHRYQPTDFKNLQGVVLMTEKDAVKCGDARLFTDGQEVYYLKLDTSLPQAWETEFIGQVRAWLEAPTPARVPEPASTGTAAPS